MASAWQKLTILLLCLITTGHAAFAETLHDRVIRTGKIKAAYAVYFPLFMRDPNTKKFSGIGYETLLLIAKRLGLQLEMTEEVSTGTMIEGLRGNRYDVMAFFGLGKVKRARGSP